MKNVEYQGMEAISIPSEECSRIEGLIRSVFTGWQPEEYGEYPLLGVINRKVAGRAYAFNEIAEWGFCLPGDQDISGHHTANGTFNWSAHVRMRKWESHFSQTFNRLAGTDYQTPFTPHLWSFVTERYPEIVQTIKDTSWLLDIPVLPGDQETTRSIWYTTER